MSTRPAASAPNARAAEAPQRSGLALRYRLVFRELGVLLALVAITLLFFSIRREFLSLRTVGDILTVAAELAVVATGVTLLMTSGEFDLSVGSNFALSAMILALGITRYALPPLVALILALAAGALIGLLNGFTTLGTGIPSFITTLGTMMLWRGIGLFVTGGWPISVMEDVVLLRVLGGAKVFGSVQTSAVWCLIVGLVFWCVLVRTPYGNWTFATGGKPQAARAVGAPVRQVKLINFTLTGLLAAFGGVLQLGRMGSMSPAWGDQLPLEAIAAAVIGGTALSGGIGTIVGTVLGAVTMAAIRIGLVMIGAPAYWYMAFVGVFVILAVVINVRLREAMLWTR